MNATLRRLSTGSALAASLLFTGCDSDGTKPGSTGGSAVKPGSAAAAPPVVEMPAAKPAEAAPKPAAPATPATPASEGPKLDTPKPAETSTKAKEDAIDKALEAAPKSLSAEKPAAEAKPAEAKPAESKPAAGASSQTTPASEQKPVATESKPAETKSPEAKTAETPKPAAEASPAAAKPAEAVVVAAAPKSVAAAPVTAAAVGSSQLAFATEGAFPFQSTLGGKSVKAAPVVGVGKGDWNQWGGSSLRNNIPEGKNIASEWDLGSSYLDSGEFKKEEASENVMWAAPIGSQSYGNPIVANGKIFVGTNNGHGWLKRYPASVDLGCLLAFDQKTGKFLWQHSSEKLPTGRVHDWPLQGICCSPLVEGDKLWFVSSRGLVLCLDTEGFHDGENDGDKKETNEEKDEADVIWTVDMMNELGVSQHNMCSCSVTSAGDILFVCTSNGVDESHINLPAPNAPSFIALDKKTGKLLWKDGSPGDNILHGQWSSPAYAVIDGVPQIIFAGGDGWLYSFKADAGKDGKAELLWRFDANPKESKYILGGRGTRNEIIATPVVYNDLVYLAVGQDPEHGEGIGHLWCIDPKKRGDISAELAVKREDPKTSIPHRRLQAVETDKGEMAVPNPNTGVVWHYSEYDGDGNKKIDFEETMHRSCGTVVIKDDLLYLADFSGLFHCVDATSGKPYWTHDLFAAVWGSALIVDGKVYVGDEEGKISVFKHDKVKKVLAENEMGNSVYTTPVVADNFLYVANKTHIFAIAPDKE
jgi:outer membrane protein assembly factor BamB